MSTRYQNEIERRFSDQKAVDDYSMRMYGMKSADVEMSLLAQIDVARGRMPTGDALAWAHKAAKAQYGWTPAQTNAELRRVTSLDTPQKRIYGYLSAGGNAVTEQVFNHVMGMVQGASRADMEIGLAEKMAETDKLNDKLRDQNAYQFDEKNNARVRESAEQRNNLRDALKLQLGATEAQTLSEQRQRVVTAKNRLADRMDARELSGEPLSLRDQLADNFDLHKINAASIDAGLGDVIGSAEEIVDREAPHMDINFDVTEGI